MINHHTLSTRLALSYWMWPKGQRSTYPNLIAWNAIKWAPNDKMCATADCLLPPRIGRKRKDSSKVTNSLVFAWFFFFFFFTRLGWAYRFSLNTQFVILYLGDYRKIWPSNTFRPLPFNFQLSTASFKTSERLTICNCFLARGRKNIRMMFLTSYLAIWIIHRPSTRSWNHEVRPIIRPCPFESDPAAISYLAAYTPRSTLNQQFYSIEK